MATVEHEKIVPQGGIDLTKAGVEFPPSVVSGSSNPTAKGQTPYSTGTSSNAVAWGGAALASTALIDLNHEFGLGEEDITGKVGEALSQAVTAGHRVIDLRISKELHYGLEGPVKEGTAFGKSYAGQVLLPARTTEEGPLVIRLSGVAPASKVMLGQGGEKVTNLPGVVLISNATSGNVFDVIPGFEAISGYPFSDLVLIFEDLALLTPTNPQCGGIHAYYSSRLRLRNVTIGALGEGGVVAPPNSLPTGTAQGFTMPSVNNAGSHRFESLCIYGYATAIGQTEHGLFDQVYIGYCAKAIKGLGAAHANHYSYVNIEECPTALYAEAGGGGFIHGLIDYEDPTSAAFKQGSLIEDPLNLFKGVLTIYNQTNGFAGNPIVGARALDIINPAQGGASWKGVYPYDNFERTASISGNIGNCAQTSHPWKVVEGQGTITAGSTKAEPGKLSNAEAKAFRAYVSYVLRTGTGSRSVRYIVKTGSAYDVRLNLGHVANGHELRVKVSGGNVLLELVGAATSTLAEAKSVVSAETQYEITVAVSHPKYLGAPEEVQVFLGETEILAYKLTSGQRAELPAAKTNSERLPLQLEDGLGFGGSDSTSVFELFNVIPLGSQERGPEGGKGVEGSVGPAGPGAIPVGLPMSARGAPIATTTGTLGKAFKASVQRSLAYKAGHIVDVSVWNGSTVAGSMRGCIFDLGEAAAGKYTPLWEGAEVVMSGANGWQSLGNPALAVTASEQFNIALMSSSETATFGVTGSLLTSGAGQLPAGDLPVAGGALPKIVGYHEYAELKFAVLTEAQLNPGGPMVLIKYRIE